MLELPKITYSVVEIEAGPVDLEVDMFEQWRRAGGDEKLRTLIDGQEEMMANMIRTVNGSHTPMRDLLPILQGAQKSLVELRMYTGLAKVPAVLDIIRSELDAGLDKIVLFAVHRNVIEALRVGLAKYGAVTLYGGSAPETRQKNIDKFQKHPKCRVFIANIGAAGTAINLTAACELAFVEQDWTNANNAQATMRVHRIGQARPVRARFFALAQSTDERISEVLRRKLRDELEIFG